MNGGNNTERKLKIIGETILAMQEIYQGQLPDNDKCDKIIFLINKMYAALNEVQEGTNSN